MVPHIPSSCPARAQLWKRRCCIAVCLCIMQSGTTTPSSCPARAQLWKRRCCIAVCLCIMQSGTTHTIQLPCTCTIVEKKVLHCRVFMYNAERNHTHLPAALHVQQCGTEGARGRRKQSHVGPEHSLTEHRCSGGQDRRGH